MMLMLLSIWFVLHRYIEYAFDGSMKHGCARDAFTDSLRARVWIILTEPNSPTKVALVLPRLIVFNETNTLQRTTWIANTSSQNKRYWFEDLHPKLHKKGIV